MCREVCNYRNYQTFSVAVDIDQKEANYKKWHNRAKVLCDNAQPGEYVSKQVNVKFMLADELKASYSGRAERLALPDTFQAILDNALYNVDWDTIAQGIIDTVRPEFLEEVEA